ncbi:MAG: FG-GAP-like repeat-containing protein [bacterium]
MKKLLITLTLIILPRILFAGPDIFIGCYCWRNTGNLTSLWAREQLWDIPYAPGGPYIHTSFCDLDNDGDFDAYVTGDVDTIIAFENTGSDTFPIWQSKSSWGVHPAGMSQIFWADFIDIDGDGKKDLSIAKHDTIKFYKNTGTTLFAWTREPIWDLPIQGNLNLAHTYTDLDNDKDYDVMVRIWGGTCEIKAFENTGTPTNPSWQEKPTWGITGRQSQPALGDLDGDNDADLICSGDYAAYVFAFENTGDSINPVWTQKLSWLTPDSSQFPANYPEFVDIDDHVAGVNENPKSIIKNPKLETFPNPLTTLTEIKYKLLKSAYVKIDIYNLAGRKSYTLVDGYRSAGRQTCRLSGNKVLTSGIYFISFSTDTHKESKKMIITR